MENGFEHQKNHKSRSDKNCGHLLKNTFENDGSNGRVLVLYTGGTIGMVRNVDGVYVPVPNALVSQIRKEPRMHDEKYCKMIYGHEYDDSSPLILPYVRGLKRVEYFIQEYDKLIDSCNITQGLWNKIAGNIREYYESYDGFVILHGTDTLSYTASALSFMLENLGKTVIVTGSQIPIFEVRSDGGDNFIGALLLAGNFTIPEVTVFFHNKLLRGTRTVKYDSSSFDAFFSPNYPELAKFGIDIEVHYDEICKPTAIDKFKVQFELNENVGLLRMFPNISSQTVRSFLQSNIKGVVLQTYGLGNFPTNRSDLMNELQEATDRGVIIVNCTQCHVGAVADSYEGGRLLTRAGVLCGYDMTMEAALSKLSYVLAKDCDLETKKEMMRSSLRGEMTSTKPKDELEEWDLLKAVGKLLNITSKLELSELASLLYPVLLSDAVHKSDIKKLDRLKDHGINLNAENVDQRTALHVACSKGDLVVVKYLLMNGAFVHVKDRYGRTPLMEAISNDHHEIIILLRECGAHLTGSRKMLGDEICSAAARGLLERFEGYKLAGANLNEKDISDRTALHMAVLHNHKSLVRFLLENGGDVNAMDLTHNTPLCYAKMMNNKKMIDILTKY